MPTDRHLAEPVAPQSGLTQTLGTEARTPPDAGWADESAKQPASLSAPLLDVIRDRIDRAGGWLAFDEFMALALYHPGRGYYASAQRKFGLMPQSGSDFVTAPELSPLFGWTLAAQVAQVLEATGTDEVYEFGPGTGALAEQVLQGLVRQGRAPRRYTFIELSADLRQRQQARLDALVAPGGEAAGVELVWVDAWPAELRGVVLGNEVLDAMPVKLLRGVSGQPGWLERGVAWLGEPALGWVDRPTALQPPCQFGTTEWPDRVTEVHLQAQAFVASLAERLQLGAAFFIDYGFPESEYYHPQRLQGTLMCHRGHMADADPLQDPGQKDITAHVNFTGIALAAQEAGLEVLGYTSQGRFLINCGFGSQLQAVLARGDVRAQAHAQRLITEHEMGELFKVIGLGSPGLALDAMGFAQGDRTHRL